MQVIAANVWVAACRSEPPPHHDSEATADTSAPIVSDGPWRSALYPEDWTPAFTDAEGRFLHDFSYAGYRAGPDLPDPPGASFAPAGDPTGATDSTAALQAAIDAASAAAPAVVDVPAGTFRVDGLLRVSTSGVVIRGAGPDATFLTFTSPDAGYGAHLSFTGTLAQGPDLPLVEDGAARATTVRVADASSLAPGDAVAVGWTITPEFTDAHGMTGTWTEFAGQWRPFFRRTVTDVAPDGTVTLDVPLRYAALVRDGASVRTEDGWLEEVGLEGVAISNALPWSAAWDTDQVHAVALSGVRDAWVRDVASFASPLATDARERHLTSGGILVVDSRRVTVADTVLELPIHRGPGGNGYLFEVSRSNEVLFRDDVARAGRHNFVQNWDFGTSGCVWLRTRSSEGLAYPGDLESLGYPAYSEFHHSLAMANLIDGAVAEDGWQAVNRRSESSGAGHSATETVFWRTSGGGFLRSLQYGWGYVIGTDGMDVHVDPAEPDLLFPGVGTEPTDWVEGLDRGADLEPASLYEDQLRRRLGR